MLRSKTSWKNCWLCLIIGLLIACIFGLSGCGDNASSSSSSSSSENNSNAVVESVEDQAPEYNELQLMFANLTSSTTKQQLDDEIKANDLSFTSEEYNASGGGKTQQYKVAFSPDVAKQKHAESGEYLEVTFNSDGSLEYAQYVMPEANGSALYYEKGTFYDFRDKMDGEYSGYYFIDHSDSVKKEKGITIKYPNGNEVKTNYVPFDNANSLLDTVIKSA